MIYIYIEYVYIYIYSVYIYMIYIYISLDVFEDFEITQRYRLHGAGIFACKLGHLLAEWQIFQHHRSVVPRYRSLFRALLSIINCIYIYIPIKHPHDIPHKTVPPWKNGSFLCHAVPPWHHCSQCCQGLLRQNFRAFDSSPLTRSEAPK